MDCRLRASATKESEDGQRYADQTNFRHVAGTKQRSLASGCFWPGRARQLSGLLALNRPDRTCPLSDCSRVMKLAEAAPASGQERSLMGGCYGGS
jgi:hypothetical protein